MIPLDELQIRIKRMQGEMEKNNIAGSLLMQRADIFYFSGTGQNAHLFIPASGDPTLVVKKSLTRARQESALKQIIPFESRESLVKLIAAAIPAKKKIGLEADVLPANLYINYQKMLADYELVDVSRQIRIIRAVKSPYEIKLFQDAAVLGEAVFNYAHAVIKEGLTEVELAGHLESYARSKGHQGTVRMRGFNQELYFGHIMTGKNAAINSFLDSPTGGSGLNPSFPQGAGSAVIQRHEPILVDFVSVLGGYMVDQTRIFSLGSLAPHLMKAYQTALEIKKALTVLGKPGTMSNLLYQRAEEIAAGAGLIDYFMGYEDKISFVGHGVGIELDELPVIARGLGVPLEIGMVFALEPKFIFPGEGTVGIEDTFMVGPHGLEQLTRFSDDLQII